MPETIVLKYYPFGPLRYNCHAPTGLKEMPQELSTGIKLSDYELQQATLAGGARESERLRALGMQG
jgi:hypothetical protein